MIARVKHLWSNCSSTVAEAIYPAQCALCGVWNESAICEECLSEMHPVSVVSPPFIDELFTCFEYEGRASQALKSFKYGSMTSLGPPMAELLAEQFEACLKGRVDWIVPVPIHWTKRFQRGFNQSELLCMALPESQLQFKVMTRARRSQVQASLDRTHRLKSLSGVFKASRAVLGKRILVIDDVTTTGATLSQCGQVLKSAGAKSVSALTFAAVP